MAGIGFRLEKILSKNSYTNLLEGYAYSAVVSAGPMLSTIFTIAMLMIITPGNIPTSDIVIFRTLVVYIYGFSLITTSFAQMIITRYISDRIFMNDYRAIVPAFVGIVVISLVIHAIIGVVAAWQLELDFGTSVTAIVLFLNIGIIWIAMIVLSAAKEFTWITKSFAAGSLLSIAAGFILGRKMGLLGLISGFTIGQALLVAMLMLQIFTEFEYRKRIEFSFLPYFKKFTSLAFIATFYNFGIWADKFVFWFSAGTGERIHSFLHASTVYDVPVFVAYLFVVPSLAMFTIRVETDFYFHYKKYFLSILNKHPLSSLEERRRNIVKSLKLSLGRMIVLQGTITVIGLFIAPKIFRYLGMTPINLGVFQIALLAAFLQVLLLTLLIIMLYFDFRIDALIMSAVFAASNLLLSMLSIKVGFSWYGYGYFISCLISLIGGYLLFNYRMKNLLYYTFVSQKIIVYREAPSAV
ncbi:MAG: exopolysaccharide Pel transporter PelG [bacterium]